MFKTVNFVTCILTREKKIRNKGRNFLEILFRMVILSIMWLTLYKKSGRKMTAPDLKGIVISGRREFFFFF